jgi:Arc/MetJ family transcription regulator
MVEMRITVTIEDQLLENAQRYSGVTNKSAVIRTALKAFVEREAGRRLAAMGGTEPDAQASPRRRF